MTPETLTAWTPIGPAGEMSTIHQLLADQALRLCHKKSVDLWNITGPRYNMTVVRDGDSWLLAINSEDNQRDLPQIELYRIAEVAA